MGKYSEWEMNGCVLFVKGTFLHIMTKPISTLMFKHPEKIQFDLVKSS